MKSGRQTRGRVGVELNYPLRKYLLQLFEIRLCREATHFGYTCFRNVTQERGRGGVVENLFQLNPYSFARDTFKALAVLCYCLESG